MTVLDLCTKPPEHVDNGELALSLLYGMRYQPQP
jgi:hypothetical protein